MEVFCRYNSPYGHHVEILQETIVVKKSNRTKLFEFSNQIEKKRVTNGRFLIKKFDLKYINNSWLLLAYCKKYFCYANKGIAYSYNRRHKEKYTTNNKAMAYKIAKAETNSFYELVAIVDTKNNGKHIYFISDEQSKSKLGSQKIILK